MKQATEAKRMDLVDCPTPANDCAATAPRPAGGTRLGRAIAEMAAAYDDLRGNVDDFRAMIDRLGDRMDDLDRSMARYDRALGDIRIERVGAKARRLARIMEPHAV